MSPLSLRDFVQHKSHCPLTYPATKQGWNPNAVCTCGLADVLARLPLTDFSTCAECGLRWIGAYTDCPSCLAQGGMKAVSDLIQEREALKARLPVSTALAEPEPPLVMTIAVEREEDGQYFATYAASKESHG